MSDVNVSFGAEIADLVEKIGQVQGLFKDLVEAFGTIATVVGGGEAFKEFIDSAQEATRETTKLAQTMGIAGDEAAALKSALDGVGSNAETYSGAFLKFSRQLATNGDTLKQYGIDVDGVRKGTVTGAQAFQQALTSIAGYKAGIDQTQAAQKLLGRGVTDVQALLRLTPELLEEARKKTEDLNLTISEGSVAASRQYVAAMSDVSDVLTGVKKTIGEELLPVFTQSAQQFASWGPTLVEGARYVGEFFAATFTEIHEIVTTVFAAIGQIAASVSSALAELFGGKPLTAMDLFKTALQAVSILFTGFGVGVSLIVETIKTGIEILSNRFSTFASVAERAFHLDWAGVASEWKAGMDRENAIIEKGMADAVRIATKGALDISTAAGNVDYGHEGKSANAPFKPPGGDKTFKPVNKNADAENSAERALLKAQEEAKLALIKEGIVETQNAVDDAYKQGLLSTQQYYASTLQLTLQNTDAQIATKRKELADTQALEKTAVKPEAKLKFQAQEAQIEGQINVLEAQRNEQIVKNSDAYRDAERDRLAALTAFQAAEAKASGDDQVAKEKAALDQEKALRQISADDAFAIEKRLEDQSYASLVASLVAKAAAVKGSEDDQAKQQQAIALEAEAAFRDHQNKLTAINNAAEQERSKYSVQAQQQTQQAFSTMISTWLQGTAKMSDAIRQFAVTVGNSLANLVAQKFTDQIFDVSGVNQAINKVVGFVTSGIQRMVTAWLGGETSQTAATTTGTTARTALTAQQIEAAVASKEVETSAVTTSEDTQTTAAVAGDEAVTASDATATTTAIASQQTQSAAAIFGYAAEAAVAAMASVAAIPIVGWALAPETGAAIYAEGLAYLASASGGYDIGAGVNPITQLHEKEMVLPATIAAGFRKIIGANGNLPTSLPGSTQQVGQISASARPSAQTVAAAQQGAGGSAPVQPVFEIKAIDSKDVAQWLMKNGKAVAKSLQNQGRNFVGVSPR